MFLLNKSSRKRAFLFVPLPHSPLFPLPFIINGMVDHLLLLLLLLLRRLSRELGRRRRQASEVNMAQ
jgi:hypothetical protein